MGTHTRKRKIVIGRTPSEEEEEEEEEKEKREIIFHPKVGARDCPGLVKKALTPKMSDEMEVTRSWR